MEERQIFLDITCFFIGEDRDMVTRIWSGSGLNGSCGFRSIQNKCLVEVDRENRIRMHDHLRDLGREIADASLPRRLWRLTEKIDDLLQQSSTEQVINEVRGIRMRDYTDGSAMPWYQRSSGLFGNCVIKLCNMQYPSHGTGICMRNLQLLDTENVLVERILTKVQSPNLIWLRWRDCPYSSLPSSISTKNLRVLRVQGRKLKTLWKNESQAPLQLRELEIYAPLSNIPKSIGKLKHLGRIVIEGMVNLTQLPKEFCLLQSLKDLVLVGFLKMKSLPECFGNLTNLQEINLRESSALERLPDSFCKLIKLQNLDLSVCTNLTMSSETLGNISTLERIDLTSCEKIEVLPQQVTHQRSLKQLLLRGTNLKEFPSAIGELSNLEVMTVGPLLDTPPPSLWDLKNLKELGLYKCKELKCLPPSLRLLTELTELRVEDCPLVRELPFKEEVKGKRETLSDLDSSIHILPRLQQLWLYKIGISEVSFAEGVCCNLRHLSIYGCNDLVEVGTLPNTLIYLSFQNCSNLRKIDQIYVLAKLQTLNISGCTELEELPRIETFLSLRKFDADRCVKLKSIRGLGQLTKLEILAFMGVQS